MPRWSITSMNNLLDKKKELKDIAVKYFKKNAIMLDKEEEKEYIEKISKMIDSGFKHVKKKALNEFDYEYEEVARELVS